MTTMRWTAATIALLLSLGACSPPAPQPRLYLLNPMAAPPPKQARGPLIAVPTVAIPEYLDRPEILARVGAHEVKPTDGDRWAERLSVNITRVIAENLAILKDSDSVVALPSRADPNFQYELSVEFSRFEVERSGRAAVAGRWALRDIETRKEQRAGRFQMQEEPLAPGYEAAVAAMNRALERISRDIAGALP